MAKYQNIKSEHQLRSLVFDDYFKNKGISWEQELYKIDFVITEKTKGKKMQGGSDKHYLWMETKKNVTDNISMITQLLLTIKKPYSENTYIIPNYVGCFDIEKIIFIPTALIKDIFHDSDIKWNIAPSDTKNEYFLKLKNKVISAVFNDKQVKTFVFGEQDEEIKNFIKNNLYTEDIENKFEITEHNFDRVYLKWVEKVKPSLSVNWEEEKKLGLLDGDFYLADLLSKEGLSFKNRLLIVLQTDHYLLTKTLKKGKFLPDDDKYFFKDKQKAYNEFWSIYKRPPADKYWETIINRKDLLVPQDIRERKGSFFTPQIWVELSQKYLADVFGEDWQDKYYIWDCCAGTGNLLVGINRKIENVFASTIDKSDVQAIYDRIDNGAQLLKKNVFQFDFLNDDFKKLPKALKDIIENKTKRKKLIIYMNPPYAEAGNRGTIVGTSSNKSKVSASKLYISFIGTIGNAILELSAQFFLRIYRDIPGSILASFSTLKYINSPNFVKFREFFLAEFKSGFVCQADTFDNVSGSFPIGFFIWDLNNKFKISSIKTDVYLYNNNIVLKQGTKHFYSAKKKKLSIDWLRNYFDKDDDERLAYLRLHRNDIQNKAAVFITSKPSDSDFIKHEAVNVTKNNIFVMAIYCSIRQVIDATWLNNKDNFLFPNKKWEDDVDFQNNCLMHVLFDNNIQSAHGTNHWIPFTEKEVNAKTKFKSNFMSNFIVGKIAQKVNTDLFGNSDTIINGKLNFTKEAKSVFDAGKELWKYYHSKSRVNVDASLYDIKLYFQGSSGGRMNNKSDDEEYNTLINNLRENMKLLAKVIEPKVYEYGFLK